MDIEEEIKTVKKIDTERIVREGRKIYEKIKKKYEPEHIGEYLAIDPKTKNVYLAKDGVDAVLKARKAQPDTIFHLIKIGYDVTESFAGMRPDIDIFL